MEPTLEDGEFALVDPDNTAYSKNKIYVVTYNDEGYIKRLEMNNKLKLITLKSDNPDYEDINMELKKLDKIDLKNFVGKIKIIKGNENRLKILNSNIESIVKYDEEKGELIVSQIGKVFFSEKYKSILELEYSEKSLDVSIKNVVARFRVETPEIGNIEIKNIVGKFYVILSDDVNLDKSNILGNVKIKNNIFISPESKLNMSIFNVVGQVVIGDGKDA